MSRFAFIIFMSFAGIAQNNNIQELEFTEILVLSNYPHEFDLSGIVKTEDKCYLINDKSWSPYAYEFQTEGKNFYLIDSVELGVNSKTDLESLDYCKSIGIFFTDENKNIAYYSGTEGKSQVIFEKNQLDSDLNWGVNKGLEGLAVDCENQVVYMAKERGPRFIISYDLNSKQVTDINHKDSKGDISDLKYQDGYLYILERNENIISKMDVTTKQVVAKVSYKNVCSHPEGKLYSNSKYGMAEALLLTPKSIWIGLDNNGQPFSKHAQNTYGLKGNKPVIIGFKRPEGF